MERLSKAQAGPGFDRDYVALQIQGRYILSSTLNRTEGDRYAITARLVGANDDAGYTIHAVQAPGQDLAAFGQSVAASPEILCERVLTVLTRLSAEVILETAFAEDGLDGAATVAHPLVQRALAKETAIAGIQYTIGSSIPSS